MSDVFYTMQVDGSIIALFGRDGGVSITNAADQVVAELHDALGDLSGKRIIYRDTDGRWDGLAHRGAKFLGFVLIGGDDRARATEIARCYLQWPV
jgi:hypothetical protein